MLESAVLICSIPFLLLFVLYAWDQQKEKEDGVKKLEEKLRELEEKSEVKTTEKRGK